MMTSVPALDQLFVRDEKKIKFFIQSDLDAEVKETLVDDIEKHGGSVTDKVPLKGYVLTELFSDEETRLKSIWASPDRPQRYFAPWMFIRSCIRARRVLQPIFLVNGLPVEFHIHSSISDHWRNKLISHILCAGGVIVASEGAARVIIADHENKKQWRQLLKNYDSEPNKYIETYQWIKICIDTDTYKHTELVKKNLGGRVAGAPRNDFTEREDRLLAAYIARQIPSKTSSGRLGNKIYQLLCEKVERGDKDYQWAARHSWQSWHNRYKTNRGRFDRIIDDYVTKHQIQEGEKGQHAFTRKSQSSEVAQDSDVDELAIPHEPVSGELHTGRKRKRSEAEQEDQEIDYDNRAGEQETGDWGIRSGTDPVPAWAHSSNQTIGGDVAVIEPRFQEENDTSLVDKERQSLHNEIDAIAVQFRWHIEDVWDEYRLQSMSIHRTREAIKGFRDVIDEIRKQRK